MTPAEREVFDAALAFVRGMPYRRAIGMLYGGKRLVAAVEALPEPVLSDIELEPGPLPPPQPADYLGLVPQEVAIQRAAFAAFAATSRNPDSPPPPAGDVVREVLRRAREQSDLDKSLPLTAAELAALGRFGVDLKPVPGDSKDEPRAFWCGTAPGWQRYEIVCDCGIAHMYPPCADGVER